MHDDREQDALRIDQDVPLAPGQFLAAIEAADPTHERLDRLTVKDRRAGRGISRPACNRASSRKRA
jgi:hypothetical protein